jgi:predicted phosphodiesterase
MEPDGEQPAPRARRAARAAVERVRGWRRRRFGLTPRRLTILRVLAFAAAGTVVGVLLGASVGSDIGPFSTTASARPALRGDTTVQLAPLGSIRLDTHAGPVALEIQVEELRVRAAERIARDPAVLEEVEDDVARDARRALEALARRAALVAAAGGIVGAVVARPTWRSALAGLAVAAVLVGGTAGLTVATFDPDAVAEPRYTGLLTMAPAAVGDVEAILDRFGEYRAQLSEMVANVAALYRAGQTLPVAHAGGNVVRVLHVSDVHNNPQAFDLMAQLVEQFEVDAVFDTGDTTDWGTEPEARLVRRMGRLGVPYVWVRGNHDSRQTQRAVEDQPNTVVLDGDVATVAGLRVWGIGDPRYTPDKGEATSVEAERQIADAYAAEVRRRVIAAGGGAIDVVLVHDPRLAAEIGDIVPLALAGHLHDPREATVDGMLLLGEGSTGGAGLRALTGDEPEPLTCSILYFDPATKRLVAFDRVTVAGLGEEAAARIERRIVDRPGEGGGEDGEHGEDG